MLIAFSVLRLTKYWNHLVQSPARPKVSVLLRQSHSSNPTKRNTAVMQTKVLRQKTQTTRRRSRKQRWAMHTLPLPSLRGGRRARPRRQRRSQSERPRLWRGLRSRQRSWPPRKPRRSGTHVCTKVSSFLDVPTTACLNLFARTHARSPHRGIRDLQAQGGGHSGRME
jgi:hypothetical protein